MEYEKLKEYLSIVLDMEKNIYIQENTLQKLYRKRNSLCIKENFLTPVCKYSEFSLVDSDNGSCLGFVLGIIIAIIAMKIQIDMGFGAPSLLDSLFKIILAIIISIVIGIACGLIIAIIGALIHKSREQKQYDYEYRQELKEYNELKESDEQRIKNESILQTKIQQEINLLEKQYEDSKKHLDEFYDYNIIDKRYRYNIVAISSFYQYLSEKRTFCLEFDRETGDRGAYNIYNEEAQRGLIISQLGKVLDKLDDIIDNQYTLQHTLIEANEKISYLYSNVDQMGRQISASIQEQTAIEAYNAERTNAELGFMNTMNALYTWK